MTSLASRTQVNLNPPQLVEDVLDQSGNLFDRIQALASAMQAINPELGGYLRAYRRTPLGESGSSMPYRLVFTHDGSSVSPEGVVNDIHAKDFFEALQDTFGADYAHQTKQNLARRIPMGKGGLSGGGRLIEAALEEAFARHRMEVPEERTLHGGATYSVTEALPIEAAAFMGQPDLAQIVLYSKPGPTESRDNPIVRLRDRFHAVLDALNKPFEAATPAQSKSVAASIAALNGMVESGSFEEDMNHGWVGYALGEGLKAKKNHGWTNFLLHQAAASPYAFYGQYSPLTLATAANDGQAVSELLQAGVSPSTVIRGWPNLFKGREQALLSASGGDYIPMIVFSAAVGSTAAEASLLNGGADPNHTTDKQDTALHHSARHGDDAAVRLLLRHNASAVVLNGNGLRPEELVPEGGGFDSLNELLVNTANRELGVVDARLRKEIEATAEPMPEPATAREVWNSHRRRIPR